MKILSIETSCDETGISLIEGTGDTITLLGNALASQIDLHAQYGGVFPAMAKRAHAEKFVPLLIDVLIQAHMNHARTTGIDDSIKNIITTLTEKDPGLGQHLLSFIEHYEKPDIDYIAVTTGPGLEPALWVGITAAKVLSALWNVPLIPINHMEGHVLVTLLQGDNTAFTLRPLSFPALALLVSGGHTELVVIHDYARYEKIGATRDDAVGEAFDKVARMLGLPYPGGPAVSAKAKAFRESGKANPFTLPRPMLHSKDYDFSFSGIKTAVLYTIRDIGTLTEEQVDALACAFEDAAIEVLVAKTMHAIAEHNIETLIVGGGVAGNSYLQLELSRAVGTHPVLLYPKAGLATDNSVMIAVAAYVRAHMGVAESISLETMRADGNLSITDGGFRK